MICVFCSWAVLLYSKAEIVKVFVLVLWNRSNKWLIKIIYL